MRGRPPRSTLGVVVVGDSRTPERRRNSVGTARPMTMRRRAVTLRLDDFRKTDREIQRLESGYLARPAGIEPATPAFGVLPAHQSPL